MERLTAAALRHPKITLALYLALFAVAGLGTLRLQSETGYRAALGAAHPSVSTLDRFIEDFGAGLTVQVAWGCDAGDCENALGPEALAAAERIAAAVAGSAGVRSVQTPGTTPLLDGTGGVIDSRTLLSLADEPMAREHFIEHARRDPFWRGNLLSEDGRAAALLVEVDSSDPQLHAAALEALLEAVSRETRTYALVGDPVDFAVGGAALNRESRRLGFVAVLVIAAIVGLLFRTPLAIVPVLTAVGVAAVSCLGLMGWMGWPENEVSQAIVPLLLVIGVCGAIHLLSRYRDLPNERSRQLDEDRCARLVAASRDVGWPCFVASTTTAVGLASFVTSDLAGFVRFGLASAFGCFVALIATFSLLPVLVRLLRLDLTPLADSEGWAQSLRALGIATRRFARSIVLLAGGALALGLAGVERLEVDVTKESLLGSGSDIVKWQKWVEQNLRKPDTLEIRLRLPDGAAISDVATLAVVSRVVQQLEGIPELGATRSLLDGVERMNMLLHGEDPAMAKLGETRAANAQLLFLLESYDRDLLGHWLTSDGRALRLSSEARLLSKDERAALLQRVRSILDESLPAGWVHEVTGPLQVFADMVTELHATQMRSFAGATVAVALAIGLCLRSLTAVLWAIGPSLLPIVLTLGAMGWMGNPLDTGTAMIAAIILGIAVDDSVHVITRYERHRRAGMRPAAAMSWSLEEVGRALVASSLTLSAGFLVMLLSSWGGLAAFGLLSACAILFALAADLLFLPALVYCIDPVDGALSDDGNGPGTRSRAGAGYAPLLLAGAAVAGLLVGIAREVALVERLSSARAAADPTLGVFAWHLAATLVVGGFFLVAALRSRLAGVLPLACYGVAVSWLSLSLGLQAVSELAGVAGVLGLALLPAALVHLTLTFPSPRGMLAASGLLSRMLYGVTAIVVGVALTTYLRVPELFASVHQMLVAASLVCALVMLLQAERGRRRGESAGERTRSGIVVGGGVIIAGLLLARRSAPSLGDSLLPGGARTLEALVVMLALVPHPIALQHGRVFTAVGGVRGALRLAMRAVSFVVLLMLLGTLAGIGPALQLALALCGLGAWVGSAVLDALVAGWLEKPDEAPFDEIGVLDARVCGEGGEIGAHSGVSDQVVRRVQGWLEPRFVAVFQRRPRGWVPVAASDSAPSSADLAAAASTVVELEELVHLPETGWQRPAQRLLLDAGIQTVVALRGEQGLRGVVLVGAVSRALSSRDRVFLRRLARQAVSALSWADAAEQLGAARSLARRGFLSASLTHDLGKPLSTIWAAARSLRKLRGDDALVDARLEEIQRVADQGLEIIDRLFEKVREDPGGTLPAGELVAMACETARQRYGRAVQVHYGGDLHRVSLATEVAEALGELLSNACRESPGDAPVEVSVQRCGSGSLWIDVVDRGPGMSEATAARAFEPWFSRRRNQGGRGLGLALSRLLVRQVGGDVEIVDRGGRSGTRIRISLTLPRGQGALA